jgi:hypothetical protein
MADSREKEMMSCEEFQSVLPAMIETDENVYSHPHLRDSELCRSLVVDLERVAQELRKLKLNKRDEGDEDGTDSV